MRRLSMISALSAAVLALATGVYVLKGTSVPAVAASAPFAPGALQGTADLPSESWQAF